MLNKLYLSLPFWLPEKVLFQPDLKVKSGVEEWDKKDQNTAQRSSKEEKPRLLVSLRPSPSRSTLKGTSM